ncbi:GAF and ANTAR domain-containing protein [Streptomyces sp. WAC 04229]|uniref:GAF and ANTAR domain-containing protein n=1 Tax=Streptomyces sp. WAC 04229 TaxID=2203206 RepID=UPI003D749DA3
MARDLASQSSVQATLDKIVAYAVDLVDGCEDAGILVIENKRVTTLSAHGDLVQASDKLQGEVGEGPCFDATRNTEPVYRIEDLTRTAERWKRYTPRARELGVGSMMGFCLYTDDDNLGALNIYSTRPGAFTERSEHIGWLLASHAAVAFASAREHAQLHAGMASRHDIGEALGIIMERYKITEEEAFAVLKKSSQDHNIKLRDVARRIGETGEIPGID